MLDNILIIRHTNHSKIKSHVDNLNICICVLHVIIIDLSLYQADFPGETLADQDLACPFHVLFF